MNWKENPTEHARLWTSATKKIALTLGKHDLQLAMDVFSSQHESFIEKIPDEKNIHSIFFAWLFACFYKDNTPLIPWFIQHHKKQLTQEELEVLLAAHESQFGAFQVENQNENTLELIDPAGKKYAVETVDFPRVQKRTTFLGRLVSKGPQRWFCPGKMIVIETPFFNKLSAHRKFYDSWHKYLVGFFNYMQKEQNLSEKTADKHADNANLLTMFLEEKIDVDSFRKVTKTMLKTQFSNYCKKYIHPKPDMDKVYYSLYWFFNYLEEKGEKNDEALDWLRKRIS